MVLGCMVKCKGDKVLGRDIPAKGQRYRLYGPRRSLELVNADTSQGRTCTRCAIILTVMSLPLHSADKFEVSQSFLLQQAAWLYERQLSQVRAQMRKVGASRQSATPSPAPGSASASVIGGHAMKRAGSGGKILVLPHERSK